jgi:hypothetical protein
MLLEEEPDQVTPTSEVGVTSDQKQDWPKALKDWATMVRAVLAAFPRPLGVEEVAGAFNGRVTSKRLEKVGDILDMLTVFGQASVQGGKYSLG